MFHVKNLGISVTDVKLNPWTGIICNKWPLDGSQKNLPCTCIIHSVPGHYRAAQPIQVEHIIMVILWIKPMISDMEFSSLFIMNRIFVFLSNSYGQKTKNHRVLVVVPFNKILSVQ